MRRILITIDDIEFTASISNTETADKIYNALPFKSIVQRLGGEIFFEMPVKIADERVATKNVEVGDLACWSFGSTFCIFSGKTPFSRGKKPRADSFVNIFGKVEGELELLKEVKSQSQVLVRKLIDQKSDITLLIPGFIVRTSKRKKSLSWP